VAKSSSGVGWLSGLIGIGLTLHTLHTALDGFEWAAQLCPCRLGQGNGSRA